MFTLLALLIFARPFLSSLAYPGLNDAFTLLCAIVLIAWLILLRPDAQKITALSCPLLCWIAILFASVLFSNDSIRSALFLRSYLINILFFIVVTTLHSDKKRQIIHVLVIGSLLISCLAMYQYFFGFKRVLSYIASHNLSNSFATDILTRKRAFFPFVTPNALGGYLAMILPLTLAYRYKTFICCTLFSALFFTQSIGAVLSLLAGLVIYILIAKKSKRKWTGFLGIVLACCFFILIARSISARFHIQPVFSGLMRVEYWKETLKLAFSNLLIGTGIANANLTLTRYAHNICLQLLAETGILGLGAFIWFLAAYLKKARQAIRESNGYRNEAKMALIAIAILLLHNFVDFTFFLPEISMIWWVILGIALA